MALEFQERKLLEVEIGKVIIILLYKNAFIPIFIFLLLFKLKITINRHYKKCLCVSCRIFAFIHEVIGHVPQIPIRCRIPNKAKYTNQKVEGKSSKFYLG